MEKFLTKFLIYILLTTLVCNVISCKSSIINVKLTDKNSAILTAIRDFQKTESLHNKVYNVTEDESTYDLYAFRIYETDEIHLSLKDSLNAYTRYFPTEFIEDGSNLYIWNNPQKPISKPLLDILHKRLRVDSTFYKIDKGILTTNDAPIIGGNAPSVSPPVYFICKKSTQKFKKLRSKYLISVEKYPDLDCK